MSTTRKLWILKIFKSESPFLLPILESGNSKIAWLHHVKVKLWCKKFFNTNPKYSNDYPNFVMLTSHSYKKYLNVVDYIKWCCDCFQCFSSIGVNPIQNELKCPLFGASVAFSFPYIISELSKNCCKSFYKIALQLLKCVFNSKPEHSYMRTSQQVTTLT